MDQFLLDLVVNAALIVAGYLAFVLGRWITRRFTTEKRAALLSMFFVTIVTGGALAPGAVMTYVIANMHDA